MTKQFQTEKKGGGRPSHKNPKLKDKQYNHLASQHIKVLWMLSYKVERDTDAKTTF